MDLEMKQTRFLHRLICREPHTFCFAYANITDKFWQIF